MVSSLFGLGGSLDRNRLASSLIGVFGEGRNCGDVGAGAEAVTVDGSGADAVTDAVATAGVLLATVVATGAIALADCFAAGDPLD